MHIKLIYIYMHASPGNQTWQLEFFHDKTWRFEWENHRTRRWIFHLFDYQRVSWIFYDYPIRIPTKPYKTILFNHIIPYIILIFPNPPIFRCFDHQKKPSHSELDSWENFGRQPWGISSLCPWCPECWKLWDIMG